MHGVNGVSSAKEKAITLRFVDGGLISGGDWDGPVVFGRKHWLGRRLDKLLAVP